MESTESLSTPTLLLHGAEDRCELRETTDGAKRYFTGPYRRIFLKGVGHFPQREASTATVSAILNHIQAPT